MGLGTFTLIVDFLNNTRWFRHGRSREQIDNPLILQKVDGGEFWPKNNVYIDCVGAARHFIISNLEGHGK
jgi:hypothetical protein